MKIYNINYANSINQKTSPKNGRFVTPVNFTGLKKSPLTLLMPITRLTHQEAVSKGYTPVYNITQLHEMLTKAKESPYVPIFDVENLILLQKTPKLKIILMEDIKLDATKPNNWIPIETFGGEFNGNNYKIIGLRINEPQKDNIGLFRTIKNAKIENLILEDAEVTGANNTGAIVGMNNYNFNSNSEQRMELPIKNCTVQGKINGKENVGSIVGCTNYAAMQDCYSTGEVTGSESIGGLIGSNKYSRAINSVSDANVSGDMRIGGVVGYNVAATVDNAYSKGKVTGNRFVGGLVGYDYLGKVKNCKTKASVTGKELDSTDQIVGATADFSEITNCIANGKILKK